MTVDFRESFSRDLRAVKDKAILTRVKEVIEKVIECESLIDVPNVKRMKGNPGFYRIRIGDYRVGLMVEGEVVTFVRFLHRREVYRYFP